MHKVQRATEAVHEHFVVGHDRVLVGHEVLEAGNAVLAHEDFHLAMYAVVPPGYGDVEGVIAGRFLGPAAPCVERLEQRLLRIRNEQKSMMLVVPPARPRRVPL